MNQTAKLALVLAGFVGALLSASPTASAAIYHLAYDTSSLVGNTTSSPFYLDFQLSDGSGGTVGNANSTVSISNFGFGGGSASGSASLTSGASGSLASGFSLTDSEFFNDAYQAFTPGSVVSFDVTTNFGFEPITPDGFAFSILDKDLFSIPTTGFADSLFFVDAGSSPVVGSGAGAYSAVAPVPEPATTFFGLALAGAAGAIRRRKTALAA